MKKIIFFAEKAPKRIILAVFLLSGASMLYVDIAEGSHFRGGTMSAAIDASGKVTVTVETLWRKGGSPVTDFPLSGVTRTVFVGGIQARFEVLNGISRAVLASSVSNPAPAINIVGTTVSTDLSDPNFDIRRQVFVVDLPALGIGQGSYILYWNDTARLDGINNASGAFSLECGIIYDQTPRATPEITQRINTTVTKGFLYTENLNASGTSALTYDFIVGAFSPRFGPVFNPPGITVNSSGQVEISAANTATLNEDNLAGQPAGDYVFKGQITDSDGQYIEQDVLLDVVLTQVAIDIKPGSDPNSVNCQNPKEVIPVAILATAGFDVMQVDPSTVNFGWSGAPEMHGTSHIEDVDGDGDQDLLFHFLYSQTGIMCNEEQATLGGFLYSGMPIRGTDLINLVEPSPVFKGATGTHDGNDVVLYVAPNGHLAYDGTTYWQGYFPKRTSNQYIFDAGPWVGGIVDDIPTVAELQYLSEFVPSEIGNTGQPFRVFNSSISADRKSWPPEFSTQAGEPIIIAKAQNLVVQYNDLYGTPARDVHQPLGIELRQRSLAYGDAVKRSAIIFLWEIKNISTKPIQDAYVGFWADVDIGDAWDDRTSTVNDMAIVWDNDFLDLTFTEKSAIVAFDFLETPGNLGVRNYTAFTNGPPNSDPHQDGRQYSFLSGANHFETGDFIPRDVRMLLSTGPFDLSPGQGTIVAGALLFARVPVATTWLGGDPVTFRPFPNDAILAQLLQLQTEVRKYYDLNLKGQALPKIGDEGLATETGLSEIPKEFALRQNYPNPFNPETEIRFELPQPGNVVLKIYDLLGREVRTLVDRVDEAGYYSVRWDGRDNNGRAVSTGTYIYRIQAGSFNDVRKMSLIR